MPQAPFNPGCCLRPANITHAPPGKFKFERSIQTITIAAWSLASMVIPCLAYICNSHSTRWTTLPAVSCPTGSITSALKVCSSACWRNSNNDCNFAVEMCCNVSQEKMDSTCLHRWIAAQRPSPSSSSPPSPPCHVEQCPKTSLSGNALHGTASEMDAGKGVR